MKNDMGAEPEELTYENCREYQKRAKSLGNGNTACLGKRKELATELQKRCNIPEIWALNIINGFHAKDYIAIIEKQKRKELEQFDSEYATFLEWLAEQEEEQQMQERLRSDEMNEDE